MAKRAASYLGFLDPARWGEDHHERAIVRQPLRFENVVILQRGNCRNLLPYEIKTLNESSCMAEHWSLVEIELSALSVDRLAEIDVVAIGREDQTFVV